MRPAMRVAAALACLPLIVLGLWVSLFALIAFSVGAQRPDPTVLDGDPCCGYPDTWGDVARALSFGVAIGYVAVALALVVEAFVI